jgi:2-polyprenyl-3-methyl-5-hydroxy-6-metoxy-1,4-benzoquinol methylase
MSVDLQAAYNDVYRAKRPNRTALRVDRWPTTRAEACVRLAPGGRRMLDVGCGNGLALYNLREKYRELHGVELSTERAKTSELTLQGLHHRVQVGNIESGLDYEDGYFDTLVISDVIEHVVNLWPATEEIARLVRPGGQVVLTTPNIASLKRRLTLLAGVFPATAAFDEGFEVRTTHELHDKGHLHYFTYSMLHKLFRRYGFSHVANYGFGRFGRLHNVMPSLLSSCCTVVATR